MNRRERIIIALDFSDAKQAMFCAEQLAGIASYVKVGMQLYYATGPSIVDALKNKGFNVFVDLKVHDIPNTAKGAMQSLASLGADMVNVHAAGGMTMMAAAREGLEIGTPSGKERPLLIAVTQLTSTNKEMMNKELQISGSVEDVVRHYGRLAKDAGLDGVVASPLEVKQIKRECGSEFLIVTPGIRPQGSAAGDQKRVTTPAEAFTLGSDFIVIGRPVTMAEDPRKAWEEIARSVE